MPSVKMDHAGMAAMLRSAPVAKAVLAAAEAVADNVGELTASNGDAIEIKVGAFETDRAAAGVTIAHPAGLAFEAKYGTLARAAEAAGLEVTAKT